MCVYFQQFLIHLGSEPFTIEISEQLVQNNSFPHYKYLCATVIVLHASSSNSQNMHSVTYYILLATCQTFPKCPGRRIVTRMNNKPQVTQVHLNVMLFPAVVLSTYLFALLNHAVSSQIILTGLINQPRVREHL